MNEYFYLIKYDNELKNNCVKLCKEEKVEETIGYLKFLNAKNIKIYQIDFENELIALVFGGK